MYNYNEANSEGLIRISLHGYELEKLIKFYKLYNIHNNKKKIDSAFI